MNYFRPTPSDVAMQAEKQEEAGELYDGEVSKGVDWPVYIDMSIKDCLSYYTRNQSLFVDAVACLELVLLPKIKSNKSKEDMQVMDELKVEWEEILKANNNRVPFDEQFKFSKKKFGKLMDLAYGGALHKEVFQ